MTQRGLSPDGLSEKFSSTASVDFLEWDREFLASSRLIPVKEGFLNVSGFSAVVFVASHLSLLLDG